MQKKEIIIRQNKNTIKIMRWVENSGVVCKTITKGEDGYIINAFDTTVATEKLIDFYAAVDTDGDISIITISVRGEFTFYTCNNNVWSAKLLFSVDASTYPVNNLWYYVCEKTIYLLYSLKGYATANYSSIYFRKFDGTSWSTVNLGVATELENEAPFSVTSDSEHNIYIIYKMAGKTSTIYYRKYNVTFNIWSSATKVFSSPNAIPYFQILSDFSNELIIAWSISRGNSEFYFRRYSSSKGILGEKDKITTHFMTSTQSLIEPTILIIEDTLWIMWNDNAFVYSKNLNYNTKADGIYKIYTMTTDQKIHYSIYIDQSILDLRKRMIADKIISTGEQVVSALLPLGDFYTFEMNTTPKQRENRNDISGINMNYSSPTDNKNKNIQDKEVAKNQEIITEGDIEDIIEEVIEAMDKVEASCKIPSLNKLTPKDEIYIAKKVPNLQGASNCENIPVAQNIPEVKAPPVAQNMPEVKAPPVAQNMPEVKAPPVAQNMPEVKAPPVAQNIPEVKAPPVAQNIPDVKAPPVAQNIPDVKAPPVAQNIPEVKAPPVAQNMPEVKAPPVAQNMPDVKAPPVAQNMPEVKAPPVAQNMPDVKAPSVAQDMPEVKAPSVAQNMPDVKAPPVAQNMPEVQAPPVAQNMPEVKAPPVAQDMPEGKELSATQAIPDGRESPASQNMPNSKETSASQDTFKISESGSNPNDNNFQLTEIVNMNYVEKDSNKDNNLNSPLFVNSEITKLKMQNDEMMSLLNSLKERIENSLPMAVSNESGLKKIKKWFIK